MENNKTVLIVEDDASLLTSLSTKFKKEGFEVIEASNGLDGLNFAVNAKPDVIILDILMGTMTGFEMLQKLREDQWGKLAKVVVITNLPEENIVADLSKYSVDHWFTKTDLSLERIVSTVRDLTSTE